LKPQKQKFQVGDQVRVWKYHRTFKRGYDSNCTDEYFTIHRVLKNLPVIRYQLKDFKDDKIVGNYFQEELVLYKHKDFYKINIIGEKGHGKKRQLLVNWEGWPDSYNQWISASQVENYYQNYNQNSDMGNSMDNSSQEEVMSQEFETSNINQNSNNDKFDEKHHSLNELQKRIISVDFVGDKDVTKIENKSRKSNNRKRSLKDFLKSSKRKGSQKLIKVNVIDNVKEIIDITKNK